MPRTTMNDLAIVVPTYNRYENIKKLLSTIPKNINIYISDNGNYLSSSLYNEFPNSIIKHISPSIDVAKNWNSAAKMAHEDWFSIPSDDDFYYENAINTVDKHIQENTDCDLIIFGHNVVDQNDNVISSWCPKSGIYDPPNGFELFRYGVEAKLISIFMKKSLYNKLGGFDESFRITATDSYFIQKALLSSKVLFVPEIISAYRVWTGSATHKTVATTEWMEEIELWTTKIDKVLKKESPWLYSKKIKDEIYARNLCSGIKELKSNGEHLNAVKHFLRCRYPYRANLISQLKIFVRMFQL